MDQVAGDVHFMVFDPEGNLIIDTQNNLNWDPSNPGAVTINVGTNDGNSVGEIVTPAVIPFTFTLTCVGPGGQTSATVIVNLVTDGSGIPDDGGVVPGVTYSILHIPYPYTRFCDGEFTCNDFSEIPEVSGPIQVKNAVCATMTDWLDVPPEEKAEPPIQGSGFISELRDIIHTSLDPASTMVARTKQRLRLSGELADRFDDDYQGDPLGQIMWSPTFPQPMYESLKDISHDLLLPGVAKIPPNTLGLLRSNRRFLESYMCGCNHEFAGELLWRGYPTDQRGSYFRQFWGVEEFVPSQELLNQLYADWLNRPTTLDTREFKEKFINKHDNIELVVNALTEPQVDELAGAILRRSGRGVAFISIENKRRTIVQNNIITKAVRVLSNYQLQQVLREVVTEIELEEWLKDIKKLTSWGENPLAANKTKDTDMLILVVRGDLLKRYPGALIYAIDAVHNNGVDGDLVPALPEYIKPDANGMSVEDIIGISVRQFPVFKATLPTDLTFFGFAFEKQDALSGGRGNGKAFVIEERVTDARFGLDMPSDPPVDLQTWNDLSWSHVGFGVSPGTQNFGMYLDYSWRNGVVPITQVDQPWNQNTSAAKTARITCQKPVRIAVHANQMIPPDA